MYFSISLCYDYSMVFVETILGSTTPGYKQRAPSGRDKLGDSSIWFRIVLHSSQTMFCRVLYIYIKHTTFVYQKIICLGNLTSSLFQSFHTIWLLQVFFSISRMLVLHGMVNTRENSRRYEEDNMDYQNTPNCSAILK